MWTKSRSHAERLWRYTAASNAAHEQYLSDPELLREYEQFLDWQINYQLQFYADFRDDPGWAEAIQFIVSDLNGTDISTRDADMARIVPVMVRLLPDRGTAALASAMKLNARVLDFNLETCRHLAGQADWDASISERDYCTAFRHSMTLDQCLRLIDLTIDLGQSLKRLVRSPMIGMTMRAMHYPAHAAGFGAMQDFLEKGYTTFQAIDDIDDFLERFAERMTVAFTWICEEPLANLDTTPVRYG